MCMTIGTGLEPNTAEKYRQEWDMYVRFCKRERWIEIPGRDRPWHISAIGPYLRWRASQNNARSIAQIKSKLKHCGLCYNYMLPTARGEGPSKLRLQLAMISKSIAKDQGKQKKAKGVPTGPKRALALGRAAVSLLFSAYSATTKEGFKQLSRQTRHYLAMCVTMHTGCMRFRLMQEIHRKGIIRWSQPYKAFLIVSEWRKMKQLSGEYTVKFPATPKFQAMWYDGYDSSGNSTGKFTAALVLKWQIEIAQSNKGKYVFEPERGKEPSARRFKEWIRTSFRTLLTGKRDEIEALSKAMTPHSFRAGLASDLERNDVPRPTIKKLGRWASERAMEQYMRDGLAQKICRLQFWHVQHRHGEVTRRTAQLATIDKSTDDSEGYDECSME